MFKMFKLVESSAQFSFCREKSGYIRPPGVFRCCSKLSMEPAGDVAASSSYHCQRCGLKLFLPDLVTPDMGHADLKNIALRHGLDDSFIVLSG